MARTIANGTKFIQTGSWPVPPIASTRLWLTSLTTANSNIQL